MLKMLAAKETPSAFSCPPFKNVDLPLSSCVLAPHLYFEHLSFADHAPYLSSHRRYDNSN